VAVKCRIVSAKKKRREITVKSPYYNLEIEREVVTGAAGTAMGGFE